MTADKFEQLLKTLADEQLALNRQGRAEYTETSDVLDNFKRIAVRTGVTPEVVWAVYAGKHFDGIMSYVRGNVSQREDVRGRIKDLALYLMLFYAMVEEKEVMRNETPNPTV